MFLPTATLSTAELRPDDERTVVVTGGAGFIGSNLVRRMLAATRWTVVNADALTYAGNLESLADVAGDARYNFEQVDIRDADAMRGLFTRWQPDAVMHLAAESHVDRSIDGPAEFLQTNVIGTYTLLDAALRHWRALPPDAAARFRFLHVSTDEVFGSLPLDAPARFDETTRYDPSSPYSASKAASDHLVNAWMHTYGLPCVTTNCSNNYGPYQFPEKLIPLMILRALRGERLPVYGAGENVRDWLHVHDHADALLAVLARGRIGETYCIGGDAERRNLDVVHAICALVDELAPDAAIGPRSALIEFVADRPGHDLRYAIDSGKLKQELGWRPRHSFDHGLRETVLWYLHHRPWCERVASGAYRQQRLGLSHPA